jgi:low affinity Fe/Cu permease
MSQLLSKPSHEPAKPEELKPGRNWFGRFAGLASAHMGSRWAFSGAILVIVIWAMMGPLYHYSDTWQLVINTGTTIITFLMVFLIQNTQNRDARAINLKLNELIHAIDKAKNHMIDIENLSDLELEELSVRYEKIRVEYLNRKTGNLAAN